MSESSLEKRYEAMCASVVKLERRIVELQTVIALLESQKRQWEIEKANQQRIIQQALNTSNSTNNSYLEENQRLQQRIKELGG